MDEKQLQELYNSIVSKDSTYKDKISYDLFKQKMADKAYSDKIMSWLGEGNNQDKTYQARAKAVQQPTGVQKFQADVSVIPSIKPKETPSFVKEQVNTITPELLSKQEEFVVPELRYKFGPLGFKFEESGFGTDYVKVTSPDGKKIEVSLDDNGNIKDTERLKNFLTYRSEAIPNINNLVSEYEGEKKKFNSKKEIGDSITSFSKKQNDVMSKIIGTVKKRDSIEEEIDRLNEGTMESIISVLGAEPRSREDYEKFTKEKQRKVIELVRQRDELNKDISQFANSKEYKSVESERSSLKKAVGSYTTMKAEQGNMPGAFMNGLLTGVGRITASYVGDFAAGLAKMMGQNIGLQQKEIINIAKEKGIKVPENIDIRTEQGRKKFDEWFNTLPLEQREQMMDDANDKVMKLVKYGAIDEETGTRRGGISDLFRQIPKESLGDKSVTTEYEDLAKSEFWAGSLIGLAESIPAMIGAPGPAGWAIRTANMFSLTKDYVEEEMAKDPEFENISESEKAKVVLPYAIASAVLESYGIRNIIQSKGVLNNIIYRALNKSGAGATSKTFSEFVRNEVKSGLARGTLVITAGALAEAETGSAQRALEIGIKEVYNASKGKEMFKNLPQTYSDIIKDVAYSGAQEAVGGLVIGTIPGAAAAYRKQGFLGMSDSDFEMFEAAANDPLIEKAFIAELKSKVNSGDMTMASAKEMLNDYRKSVGLFNSLPENLITNGKKEAMNLLREKRELERQIENKDDALVAPQKERIKSINEQLTKLSQNAIQEQSADAGMLRGEGPQVGLQEVVQGDQEPQVATGGTQAQVTAQQPPVQITGLPISDPELDTRITDEKQKGVLSFAKKAVNAISSIMPGVELVVHDNSDSYKAAVFQRLGKESKDVAGTSGYFTYDVDGSVRIDIDLSSANNRTVAHEVTHAVLYKKFNEDFTLFKDFRDRLSGVISSMAPQDFVDEDNKKTTVKDQLADFVSRYKKKGDDVQAEEFITELSAMLANNEAKISTSGWNKISTFIGDFVSKITGGKVNLFEGAKTTRDVVDFFNSMSKAIATGEDVSGINFARRGGQAPATGQVAQGGKASINNFPKVTTTLQKDGTGIGVNGNESVLKGDNAATVYTGTKGLEDDYSTEDILNTSVTPRDRLVSLAYSIANGVVSYRNAATKKIVNFDLPIVNKDVAKKINNLRNKYKNTPAKDTAKRAKIKNAISDITKNQLIDFQNAMTQNILALYDTLTSEFISVSKNWYLGANRMAQSISNKYNIDINKSGAIIAVLSPQNDWFNNASVAERVSDVMSNYADTKLTKDIVDKAVEYNKNNGSFVRDLTKMFSQYGEISINELQALNQDITSQSLILRAIDHSFNSPKVAVTDPNGKFIRFASSPVRWNSALEISKAISVFRSKTIEDIDLELGNGNKVRNFYNNIVDPESKTPYVTADTHAFSAALNSPISAQDASGAGLFNGGKEPIYALVKGAYIDAANIVGIKPREMQSIIWEAQRMGINDRNRSAETKQKSFEYIKNNRTDERSTYERATELISRNRSTDPTWAGSTGIKTQKPNTEILEGSRLRSEQRFGEISSLRGPSAERVGGAVPEVGGAVAGGAAEGRVKGKASRTEPLIADKKILSQMTEDNDGNFLFYHVSPNKISGKIDPKFFGRNLRTGRDERPGIGISMYYTRPDRADVSGQYRYVAAIPKENVYPFNEDPLNLYDKAEAEFNKMFPGQAFDPNKQVAFISREAEKLGYQMTVAKWGDGLRAQTTKAIRPEWLERPNGNKVEVNEKFKDFKANSKTAVKGKASMMAPENIKEINDVVKKILLLDYVNPKKLFRGSQTEEKDTKNLTWYSENKDFARGFGTFLSEKTVDLGIVFDSTNPNHVQELINKGVDLYNEYDDSYFTDAKDAASYSDTWDFIENSDGAISVIESLGFTSIKILEGGSNVNYIVLGEGGYDMRKHVSSEYKKLKKDNGSPEFIKSVEKIINNRPESEVKGKASRMAPENVVSEKTLPGYDSLVAGIAKYVSNAISRGDSKADIVRTAVDIAQSSPIYESANDVQREQIVREARKAAGASQKSSPSVSRLFGTAKDVKSITMTDYALLKKQIADINKGARDMKRAWLVSSRELGKYVRDMAGKGYITPKQAAAVVKKFSGVNVLSQRSIDKFVDYMQMVFDNAEYAEKISSIRAMLPNARKNLGTKIGIADGLADSLARMLSINPLLIPESVLDTYQSVVKMMSERKAVLSLRDIQDVTQDVSDVLDAVESEQSSIPSLKDLFDDYADKVLNQDGSINFAETINKMVKNNNISQDTADIMKKYKSEIMPSPAEAEKTQAEIDAEKYVLANMISSSTVNADRLPTRDERELARKISHLIKNTKLERLSLDQLNNLLSVIDNINNGYVPHIAQMLAERMESTESGTKLSKVPALVKPNLLKVAYAKIKSLLANDSAMATLIKRNSLGYIDQVFGDYKTKTLFNSVLKGVAQAQAKFDSYVSQLNERINKAENDVLRSHGYHHNNALMSKFKMMAYMLQNEYDSNPNNKQVNSAASYIKKTIDHILFNNSTFGERDAKMLQQILDKYSDQNTGQIYAAALYSSFNEAEKRAISEIRNINNDLTEKAVFTAAVIRGEKINPLNNYVHLNVLHEFRPEESTTGPAFVQSFSNSLRPSTKAKSLIERTPGAKPLNFDVFASVSRGARFVYMDYHMTPSIRTARKTIAFAKKQMKENGASRKEIEIINAIDESFETAVENVLVNNFSSSSFADDVINFMSKQGYRAVLASIPRFADELISNLSMVAFFPKDFSSGVGLSKLSYSIQGIEVMRNVGSTQTKRVFPSNTISGRLVDSQLLEQASGSKGGRAKGDVANKLTQIYNRSLKKYTNVVGLTADVLISTPDKLVMRPMWFGTFANEFKKISGVDADMDKIAENNEQYMMQNKETIDAARDKADQRSVFVGATDNAFMGVLKGVSGKDQSVAVKLFNQFNGFMSRFMINEFTTARTAVHAAVGNGMISKREGVALLAGVTTRMTLYTMLGQTLSNAMVGMFVDDEEEDEKSFDKKVQQALASTMTSLLLGRDFGNLTRGAVNYGVESVNEKYLDFLREGEYDPYKDGIQYSFIPPERKGQGRQFEDLITNLMGPLGPSAKTGSLMYKTYLGADKKEEDAIQRQEDVKKTRIPLEVFGNLGMVPLYKDIRKIVLKEMYKGLNDEKPKESKANSKKYLKENHPDLYKEFYGKSGDEQEVERIKKEVAREKKRILEELR